jgi:hypothetical protein
MQGSEEQIFEAFSSVCLSSECQRIVRIYMTYTDKLAADINIYIQILLYI